MRIREIRKEYLTAQALSYITSGLFLISYVNTVSAKELILAVGITLCAFSFLDVVIVTLFPKCIRTMELIDSYAKVFLLPTTMVAIFINITVTKEMGFFELRFFIFFFWSLVAMLSMSVSGFKVASIYIQRVTSVRGFWYKLFFYLAFISFSMGWLLIINGIYDPESAELLTSFNKWLYDPMVWGAIALLCVFPILILTPNDDDEENKSE